MVHSLIFFGSDRFSAVVLGELIHHNHIPVLVVTDTPKPHGSKGIVTSNEVENMAKNQDIKVLYYKDNQDELINFIEKEKPIGLSASFPHLFPPHIINSFAGRLYNLHPSLLPQYRNVAPGPYAIAMGDTVTGISLFPIGLGIDNGELIALQKEQILPTDTTSTLLSRLFTIGTKIFVDYLSGITQEPPHHSEAQKSEGWIFTRKLTRESGFIEWNVVQKLIANKPMTIEETKNPLIKLRLTHHPERTQNILPDLIRALDTYEKVWTIAPTKKGELNISFSYASDGTTLVLIPGKPHPISYNTFVKYYL